jgi:hypothetical protein
VNIRKSYGMLFALNYEAQLHRKDAKGAKENE